MSTTTQYSDTLGAHVLSVALIGPQDHWRKALANALAGPHASLTREITAYPGLDDVPRLITEDFDVILVELDSNPEHALELVECICGTSTATVMVYSARADSEMLVRCMRAGAREYLTQPMAANTLAEALIRASVRRPIPRSTKKALGKLLVFGSAKGGSGATTIASNFAVAVAQESEQSTVLIDLAMPLGDVALELGTSGAYSTVNALQDVTRLDAHFLAKLLIKHSSGLSVLAAPDKYTEFHPAEEAVDRLIAIARQEFEYVVVDIGSRLSFDSKTLMGGASTFYLITQVSIPELRNSNRVILEFFNTRGKHLEIVLNRFSSRSNGLDEEQITKALTRPAEWKVPSDYAAVRNAQNTATPLAMDDSPISRVIRQMARKACGLTASPDKKKRFNLFK